MALTGSMREFGISEILQMIGHQKKSGTLTIKDQNRRVEILFDQGDIVLVTREPVDPFSDLATMLVRSGMAGEAQVEQARRLHKQALKNLPETLIQSKVVEVDDLRAMINLSHLEAIYEIFLWKDGDYSYEAGPVNYPHQYNDPISSEQVLMDGYRIKDEWPLLQNAFPDLKFILAKEAGEFGAEQRPDGSEGVVYKLVNGERTIEDVIFLSRLGRFESLKALKNLVDVRRVRIEGRVERREKADRSGLILSLMAAVVVLLGLLLVGSGALKSRRALQGEGAPIPGQEARQGLFALHQQDRVAAALSLYAARKGSYPKSLEELVKEGRLEARDLELPGGPFIYQVSESGKDCRLEAPGSSTNGE